MDQSKRLLEEQELMVGQAPGWTGKFFAAFPAFKHHNYRLFFAGQFTSLIGTWMQLVALGWLVLELTNSAFWVSFANGLLDLPILLFSLPAGILADRLERKRIIIAAQIISMFIAFIFAALTQFHFASLFLILLLSFLLGIMHAVEMPTRQSFIFDVVGKKDITSAIALNVGMFNSARVIGPAIAGATIALFNLPIAFFLNGISFLAVIFALLKMKTKKITIEVNHAHPFTQLREGIHFAATHRLIGTLLLVLGFNSLVPWAYSSLMPVVARDVFHTNSVGFGLLLSAGGAGALFAAIFVSINASKVHVAKAITAGLFTAAIALFIFSYTTNFFLGFLLLFVLGFCLLMQVSLINSTIQRATPDHIRGRVMSLYSLMFLGLMPIGSIAIGILASMAGPQIALRIFSTITFSGALFYFFILRKRLMQSTEQIPSFLHHL